MAEVRRFHSPFAHWISGSLIEVAVYGAFIAVCAAGAILVASLF